MTSSIEETRKNIININALIELFRFRPSQKQRHMIANQASRSACPVNHAKGARQSHDKGKVELIALQSRHIKRKLLLITESTHMYPPKGE